MQLTFFKEFTEENFFFQVTGIFVLHKKIRKEKANIHCVGNPAHQ